MEVVAQQIHAYAYAYAHSRASESVESLSASSSAASHQNFLTPALQDLIFLHFGSNTVKTDAMKTLAM